MDGRDRVTAIRAGYSYAQRDVKVDTGDVWKNAKRIDPVPPISYLQLSLLLVNNVMTVEAYI